MRPPTEYEDASVAPTIIFIFRRPSKSRVLFAEARPAKQTSGPRRPGPNATRKLTRSYFLHMPLSFSLILLIRIH